MAGTASRLPEQYHDPYLPVDFTVSELMSDAAGSHSPYGDTEFPLPTSMLFYHHPDRASRPNLADGR